MFVINYMDDILVSEAPEATISDVKIIVEGTYGLSTDDFYLVYNGKKPSDDFIIDQGFVYCVPRLVGGKGGFGSMLRAIGAQIEKTTNREACRDLSGRRLRDINEEKRLKTWIAQQVEREKEVSERKKKKLEKLCQEPKFEFKDEDYDKERSDLPEKVEDAVLQGLKVVEQEKVGQKRSTKAKEIVKKKKPKLWVDADIDDLSSSEEMSSDEGSSPATNSAKKSLAVEDTTASTSQST